MTTLEAKSMPLDLKGLNSSQLSAVTHGEGPMLVIAGPGSGKTRVITHRIAWLVEQGVPSWKILAVTFTNKAAGEMRERVESLTGESSPWVSTFHSFGARFLRSEAETLDIKRDFTIFDQSDGKSIIKRLCKELSIDSHFLRPAELQHAISAAKNQGIGPAEMTETAIGFKDEQIAKVFEAYQRELKLNNAYDFDDLLLEPMKTLRDNETIRARYADRFQYVLVDEYQDTNGVQYQLTRLLAGQRNLCVTGDPDQSIYSWRGADLRNILDFERDYDDAKVVVLGQNYRSTKTIVAAADSLVRNNQKRKHKDLHTSNDDGSSVRAILTQSEDHEAMIISGLIRDWVEEEGMQYNDIAIFYRTNAQSRAIEQGLVEHAIPYLLVGAVAFFKRKEILDVLAYLRLLLNPNDEIAFTRAIRMPSRGVGAVSIGKLIAFARSEGIDLLAACQHESVRSMMRGKAKSGLARFSKLMSDLAPLVEGSVGVLINQLIEEAELEDALRKEDPLKGAERVENVQELITDAEKFDESNESAGLSEYMEKVSLISDVDALDSQTQAVSLMSLHSAKGLEFPAVVIAGVEECLLPHSRSLQLGPDEVEEERRLMYVGITRAKEHLALTLAMYRSAMGQSMRNSPSRFLLEIPEELMVTQNLSGSAGLSNVRGGRAAKLFEPGGGKDDDDVPFGDDGGDPWDDDVSQVAPNEGDSKSEADWEDVSWGPGLAHLVGGKEKKSQARSEGKVIGRGFFNEEPISKERPLSTPGAHDDSSLQVGDRVKHQMFGIGEIVGLNKQSSGLRAKIIFEGWGEKNLALEYAKLERLSR